MTYPGHEASPLLQLYSHLDSRGRKMDSTSGWEECPHHHVERARGKGCLIEVISGQYHLSQVQGVGDKAFWLRQAQKPLETKVKSHKVNIFLLLGSHYCHQGHYHVFIITSCEGRIEFWSLFNLQQGHALLSMVKCSQSAHKIPLKFNLLMTAVLTPITCKTMGLCSLTFISFLLLHNNYPQMQQLITKIIYNLTKLMRVRGLGVAQLGGSGSECVKWLQSKCWVGFPPEGLIEAGGSGAKMVHLHGCWHQFLPGCSQHALVPCHVDVSMPLSDCPQDMTAPRMSSLSHNFFYEPISEVISYHFCYILFARSY